MSSRGEQGPVGSGRPRAWWRPRTPCASSTSSGSRCPRSAPASSTTRPRWPATATTWSRCGASPRTRCPSPRSACSPSAGRPRSSAWQTLFGADHLHPRGAVRRRRGRGAAHHRPAARARARPRPRPSAARARDALRGARAARRHARAQLRHAGRRPPGDGPAARLRVADGPDPPAQRAARRRWSTGCSTPSSATTAWPIAGSGSKAGILGLDRLELHDQYAPIGEVRSVDYPEARRLIDESFGRFSPRVARHRGRVLRRAPHRRRAARRQARRRLLRAGRPGRVALRADELHRPHGRRDDPGPRAGPRHALHARLGGADRALGGHRARAGRGALDVRRAAGLRPPSWPSRPTRRRAGRWCPSGSRDRSPRSSARPC